MSKKRNQIVEMEFPPEILAMMPAESKKHRAWIMGKCSILYSFDVDRHHLSIAHPLRYPIWDEIKRARYELLPDDCYMAMMFPPKEYWVNCYPNAFHLWEVKELKLQWICREM